MDNNVYSYCLEPEHSYLKNALYGANNCRFAFSAVHLVEMRGKRAEYSELLVSLDAVFIRNPGEAHNRYHPICSLDEGNAAMRLADQHENEPFNEMLSAMLLPLQHFMGGQRESSIECVQNAVEERFKSSIDKAMPDDTPMALIEHLHAGIEGAGRSLSEVDVADGWEQIDRQVNTARGGDPMRNMKPLEKVDFLISLLTTEDREAFFKLYPRNFACNKILEHGELTGFAIALFGMGLTKRKGEFSGDRQEARFAAQFRDAQHIEEASRCDVFVTYDKGASELAEAVFAYAGFNTRVIHLIFPKRDKADQ